MDVAGQAKQVNLLAALAWPSERNVNLFVGHRSPLTQELSQSRRVCPEWHKWHKVCKVDLIRPLAEKAEAATEALDSAGFGGWLCQESFNAP